MERISLADGYSISRLIKGGWHLAGGHGEIVAEQALADMAVFAQAGIDTFDCADIYTGVEALIGEYRRRYPMLAATTRVHTKFVPDLNDLATLTTDDVTRVIDRSLQRLGVERLDLVQFHWWDFGIPGYVEAAMQLEELRRQGKISRIGVTNFDTVHLGELIEAGVTVFAHQLQYSLLDRRPEKEMIPFCRRHNIAVLCYGTVAGGFLSERWLDRNYPEGNLANRSLVKYRLIIDEFGDWSNFQALLHALRDVAHRHGVDIATVATRFILDQSMVTAAIVGATNRSHLDAHLRIDSVILTKADQAEISAAIASHPGPCGDVYQLERDREGPHGRIMKYNLSAKRVS